jgi:hypothetical protein
LSSLIASFNAESITQKTDDLNRVHKKILIDEGLLALLF